MESIAQAAGGSDVVDDSAAELAGLCHVEAWATTLGRGAGLLNLSPACTPTAIPLLEIGAALQHGWDNSEPLIAAGPTLKLQLRDYLTRGWGIAVSGAASWDIASGKLVAASITLPVTVALSRTVRINANAAWLHSAPSRHEWFAGGQLEADVSREISLMAEAFARRHGRAGGQVRLRWTPSAGRADFDLALGRYLDGASATALTLGTAVRF